MDFSFDNLNYNSVENVPGFEARAAFTVNSATVFMEDVDIVPTTVDETLSYIPWGGDNQLPYNVIDLIHSRRRANVNVSYGLHHSAYIPHATIFRYGSLDTHINRTSHP